jgi:uncharacterized protein YbjT (DUF2867 family)
VHSKRIDPDAAVAANSLPDSELNTTIDVGWEQPVSGGDLAAAFSKLLGRKLTLKPAFPRLAVNVILPIVGLFKERARDQMAMIRWMKLGIYVSKRDSVCVLPDPQVEVPRSSLRVTG